MKRTVFFIFALLSVLVSCDKEKEIDAAQEPSKDGIPVAILTDNGYYDGLIYYRVTTRYQIHQVVVSDCENAPVTVEIPAQIKIDGTAYTCIGINEFALTSCSAITSVTMSDSIKSIGNAAFQKCSSMKSVSISDNAITIGGGAFRECRSLTEVTIPASVESIGPNAFTNCTGITKVICKGSIPPDVGTGSPWAFDNSTCTSATLFVPKGSKSAYQNHNLWGTFTNIIEQ